jgi:hypothetical protein
MNARPLPTLATTDELIAMLDAINDRASLIGFLAPLRCPDNADNHERARLTAALIAAASRCWRERGRS